MTQFHTKTPAAATVALALGLILGACRAPATAQPPAPAPATASFSTATHYTNPIGTGVVRLGDPFALQHEGTYYLYGTGGRNGFRYYTSTDLGNWTAAGYAYQAPADAPPAGSYWAPEVTRYQGKFYMVYSCAPQLPEGGTEPYRMCLAVADSPAGPFTDLHKPWLPYAYGTIDGHIFVDTDGTPYLYFAAVGKSAPPQTWIYGVIYGVQLKADLSGPEGEPFFCSEAMQPWERPFSDRTRCNEGAFVLKRGETYYMTYSANRWNDSFYAIGYSTAPSPRGPWTKSEANPLVGETREIGLSGPGHSSMAASPDGTELFIVYHAHAPAGIRGGRTLNIDRVTFDKDGGMHVAPTRSPQPLPSAKTPAPQPK